mgnify:CR=1 FL=1
MMGLFDWFRGGDRTPAPQAATQSPSGGRVIANSWELDEFLRGQDGASWSGQQVNATTAMKVAAVYACVRIISGAVATLPLHVKRRIDARTREDASDSQLWQLVRRKPNRWQTPSQFRRMMQAHVLLRGNGVALKVPGTRGVQELIPLHPDRVRIEQNPDLTLKFTWTRTDGTSQVFRQNEVLHLAGLTLDGITGVTPITYARETIGLALAEERHGATQFKNGLNVGGYLKSDKRLGPEGRSNLREAMDDFRMGGDRAGAWMVLEDGITAERLTMTADDAQWIESRKFSRSDIAMFFGVPPHMIGDTDKSTSWGTGIEQQSLGFVAYTLEDHLTMWEEAGNRDLIPQTDAELYFRFNRAALVRGDIKTRWAAHVQALQWGVVSPNEIRAVEDMNPREGGDIFYPPPNTAGKSASDPQGGQNDPSQAS